MTEQPLTPEQVADQVQVTVKTVMRAIAAGHLIASQLNQVRGGWRILPSAVDDWLDLRSNRRRAPRPLADVTPVSGAATAAQLARRQTTTGSLKVAPDMGRAA